MRCLDRGVWYALRVRSNHEQIIAALLDQLNVPRLLPTYRYRRTMRNKSTWIERPLFPGYLFGNLELSQGPKLYKIPGFIEVVSAGKHPVAISENEMESVRLISTSNLPVAPWPFLNHGDEVTVVRGPLKGIRGVYMKDHTTGDVVVSFPLLSRAVNVRLEPDSVVPFAAALSGKRSVAC